MHIGGAKRMRLAPQAALAEQQAQVSGGLDALARTRRMAGSFVARSLTISMPSIKPLPRTSPMMLCLLFQLFQSGEDVVAELERVRLQVFALDDFEHGLAHRADDRVAAEGVEMNPLPSSAARSSAWSPRPRAGSRCRCPWPSSRCRESRPASRSPRNACRCGRSRSALRPRCTRRRRRGHVRRCA